MSLLVDVGGAWTEMGKLSQVPTRAGEESLAEALLGLDTGGSSNEVRAAQNAKGTNFG